MNRMKQGFVTSFDGTDIFYESVGDGPAFVLLDGIGCFGYAWKYLMKHFASTNRFVHMHYRGHGKSHVPADETLLSIQDICRDLAAVLDDDGVDAGILVGHSMGVQVIFEFTRMYPERVRGLVPICGSYGLPLTTFHDNKLLHTVFPFLYVPAVLAPWAFSPIWKGLLPTRLSYEIAIRGEVNGHLLKREDMMSYFHDLSSVPFKIFVKMLDHASRHTAEDMLGEVRVPTLIIGGEHDTFTPVWLSEKMQRLVPGSELLFIPHATHTAPIEAPDLINLRLEKWLRRHFDQMPPDELSEDDEPAEAAS